MTHPEGITRDDFAAGGGWSEALRLIGEREDLAIEFDEAAVETAIAAGHSRWLIDVTDPAVRAHVGPIRLHIASPPCQTFSPAGNGEGRKHLDALIRAARLVAFEGFTPEDAVAEVADEKLDVRSVLVLEPLLVARTRRPRNIVLEQVPPVLPVWEAYAEILREWGYSVWTGYVFSEQYGVPQARKRAVLTASLDREMTGPVPTHSKYHKRTPERLDEGVLPWVSLAEGLRVEAADLPAPNGGDTSWIYRRPSPTIVGSFRPDIIAAPGYRKAGDPPRQKTPGSVQVTADQAARLQSFRRDYPWQGSEAKKFEQIGNAVPPLMGAAILRSVLGR